MRASTGLARCIGIGLMLSVVGASVVSASPPLPTGQAVYDAISQAAARGGFRAQELKTAVDAYLGRHRLTAVQLGAPQPKSTRTERLGAMRLRIEGSAPWAIRVVNDTDLGTVAALDAYRRDRHGVLAALAAANPSRPIRVVIAPSVLTGVPGFAGGLACHCRGVSIVVDVFSSSGWLMSSGRQLSGEDVRTSAKRLEADLLAQAGTSLDQFAGTDRKGIHATVRRVEVEVPAQEALVLARQRDVLLVDPLTDLADAYADAAALVTVGPGPDALLAHARLHLADPFAPRPQPVKAAPPAVLAPTSPTHAVINNGATNGKDDEINGWNGLDNPDGVTGTYSIDNNWQDFSISEWAEPSHDWVRERFMLFRQSRIDKFWLDRNDKALDFEQRIRHQDYYNFLNAWNTNVPFSKAPEPEDFIQEGLQGYSEVDTEVKDITSFRAEFNYFLDLKWDAQAPPIANAPTFDSEVEYCNKFFLACNFDGTGRFWKMVLQQ